MAIIMNPRSPYPLLSAMPDTYVLVLRCETADTSAPDGANPANGTWARSDVGDLTYTFDEAEKPHAVLIGLCNIEENNATVTAKYSGYTASTGVVTVNTYTDAGTPASGDSEDLTLTLFLVCANSGLNTL